MYAAPLSSGRTDLGAVQSLGATLLSPIDIHRVFEHTPGAFRLIGEILFATGMRLEELLTSRVRDVEADGWCLVVRDDRSEPVRRLRLPQRLRDGLMDHLARLQKWHEQELQRGGGEVDLSLVGPVTHPLAGRRWCWQYVFPSARTVADPETGRTVHTHLEASTVQAILAEAGQAAGLAKPVHAPALRHAFAVEYLGKGRPLADLQYLLGHTNPATTQRYVEVLQAARDQVRRSNPFATPVRKAVYSRLPVQPLLGLDLAMAS
jgi:integrase